MKKAKIILNQQHSLLPDQERVLDKEFGKGGWEILPVPAEGWDLEKQRRIAGALRGEVAVFASPVPVLLSILSRESGADFERLVEGLDRPDSPTRVMVLHNDRREAKEISLPNGGRKVIHTVAKTGWVLV